jgi:hypothetical protein
MMKKLPYLLCLPLAVVACGDDDDDPTDAGTPADAGGGMDASAPSDSGAPADAGVDPDMGASTDAGSLMLMTPADVLNFLNGKTMLMAGMDIPTHPNGVSEDVDLGPQSQCYNQSTLAFMNDQVTVTSELGTISNMMCDRDTVSGSFGPITSMPITISNVMGNGDCFDIDVSFMGFGQEGRGRITNDGQTVELEFYFSGTAVGHRCSDGAVGSSGVTINGMAFTGDAVQVYQVQQ